MVGEEESTPSARSTFKGTLEFTFSARLHLFITSCWPTPAVSVLVTNPPSQRMSFPHRSLPVCPQMNFLFHLFNPSCPLSSPRFCRTKMGMFHGDESLTFSVFLSTSPSSTCMSSSDQMPSRFYFLCNCPWTSLLSILPVSPFLLNKVRFIWRTTTFSRRNTGCPVTWEFQINNKS